MNYRRHTQGMYMKQCNLHLEARAWISVPSTTRRGPDGYRWSGALHTAGPGGELLFGSRSDLVSGGDGQICHDLMWEIIIHEALSLVSALLVDSSPLSGPQAHTHTCTHMDLHIGTLKKFNLALKCWENSVSTTYTYGQRQTVWITWISYRVLDMLLLIQIPPTSLDACTQLLIQKSCF